MVQKKSDQECLGNLSFCLPRRLTPTFNSIAVLLVSLITTLTAATYPATGITGVSTSTASTGNTAMALLGMIDLAGPLSLSYVTSPNNYLFAAVGFNQYTNNLRLFDKDGNMKLQLSHACGGNRVVVLKDPLKLIAGSENSNYRAYYKITESAGVFSSTVNTVYIDEALHRADQDSTNSYIYCANSARAWRIDVNTFTDSTHYLQPETASPTEAIRMFNCCWFMVLKSTGMIPFLDKTNFANARYAWMSMTMYNIELDNLGNMKWVFGNQVNVSPYLVRMIDGDCFNANTVESCFAGVYNTANNIRYTTLNFGPYQYVVTFPAGVPGTTNLIWLPKIAASFGTPAMTLPLMSSNAGYSLFAMAGFMVVQDTMYFAIHYAGSSPNYHSYYLTADRCTFRDASNVCTQCLPGYYRVTTNPGNLCQLTTEFAAGIGIVTSQTYLANPCTDTKCLACLSNNAICTACNTALDYWRLGNYCYLRTAAPVGYGVNSGGGTLVACSMVGCSNCQNNYMVCASCNTASNYYMYNSVCTIKTACPSGYGVNAATSSLVPCSMAQCTNCVNDYTICTACNTAANYYMYGSVCTLKSSAPAGYGVNSAAGTIVACSMVGCLNCLDNYQVCVQCNTASNYYLLSGTCVAKASCPTGYGVNSAAGTLVTCSMTGCAGCVNDYTICTGCNTASNYYSLAGTCTLKSACPAGYGVNSGAASLVACSMTGCYNCVNSYTVCTACNTAANYYMYGSVCTLKSSCPAGYGINSAAGTLVACSMAGCLNCVDNDQTCVQCNTASNYYLMGSTCVLKSACPTGYGVNAGTGSLVPCSMTGCSGCVNDYTICTACNTAATYYSLGGVCTLKSACPTGYGVNAGAASLVACSTTGCGNCVNDYTVCTSCNTAANYYMYAGGCVLKSSCPAGCGVNSAAGTLSPCSTTGCLNCVNAYQTCVQCNVASNYYLLNGACVQKTNCPAGYGVNSVSGTLDPCSMTGCSLCVNNYQVCTGCNTGANYYMYNGACTLKSNAPIGYGVNSAAGTLLPCSQTDCQSCVDNYQVCGSCDTAAGYYMYNSVCTHKSACPSGYGIDATNKYLVPCSMSNCLNCVNSYQTCVQCNTASNYYLANATCLAKASTPPGYGVNATGGSIVPCTVAGCYNCLNDFAVCTACNVTATYYMYSGACVLKANCPVGIGVDASTSSLVACSMTGCASCVNDYQVCTLCNAAATYYMYGGTCTQKAFAPLGYGVNAATTALVVCSMPGCLNCRDDYQVCISCNTGANYYMYNGVCTLKANSPYGYGVNGVAGTLEPCSQADCKQCFDDFHICNSCDTANGFYKYNNTCIDKNTSPSGFGVNSATDYIVACTDTGCTNCRDNYQVCVLCNTASNYYMLNSTCTLKSASPAGYGINSATSSLIACSTTGCLNCTNNYQTCVQCNTTANYYMLNSGCVLKSAIPLGYGVNATGGTLVVCNMTGCLNCSNNYLTCAACNTGAGYFMDGLYCKPTSQIAAGKGINMAAGTIVSCIDPDCVNCKMNYQVCTLCNTGGGFYLYQSGCIDSSEFPVGLGIDVATQTLKSCATGIGCLDCKTNYQICIACNNQDSYYLKNAACLHFEKPVSGYGVDLLTQKVIKCTDTNCVRCVDNYQICTECDQANGYILVNGSCAMPAMFAVSQLVGKEKPENDDLAFLIKSNVSLSMNITKVVNKTFTSKNEFLNSKSNKSLSIPRVTAVRIVDNSTLLMVVNVEGNTQLPDYSVLVTTSPTSLLINVDNHNWMVYFKNYTGTYANGLTNSELEAANKQASPVAGLSSILTSNSPVATGLATTLMAADPTGTFFRFTKILQIVNKLYFININYGKRLEAFLAKPASLDYIEPDRKQYVLSEKDRRGKLSKMQVAFYIVTAANWKLGLYFLSVAVMAFKRFLLDNCIMGKVGIYFCHYANKVHLIIFNLVFIDFIWLAPRTLMHSRGLPNYKIGTAALTLILIAADLCLILAHLLDDRIWRKALEHYTSLMPWLKIKSFFRKAAPANTNNRAKLAKVETIGKDKIDGPNQQQLKQINYKRTYFEIDFNVHLMDMITFVLKVDQPTFDNKLCRVLAFSQWLRLPVMQTILVSCQYKPNFALTLLFSSELIRLFATIYAYLKYKYLKNIICLLMEVSSAAMILLFYILAFVLSPKRFDEIILDFYQDAGIWIVIASCVAEYLLLLTYIGVAAYDFFKNRKMMKKMNVKPVYNFIKYEDIPQNVPEKILMADVDDKVSQKTGSGVAKVANSSRFGLKRTAKKAEQRKMEIIQPVVSGESGRFGSKRLGKVAKKSDLNEKKATEEAEETNFGRGETVITLIGDKEEAQSPTVSKKK